MNLLTETENRTRLLWTPYCKCRDSVATAERLSSDIGLHASRIASIFNDIDVDPDVPTAVKRATARNTAKDEYLAICLLINSDKHCYGGLIHDIKNEHTRGTNTYPDTLTEAYDYLVNFKASRLSNNDQDKGGLAFYNEEKYRLR